MWRNESAEVRAHFQTLAEEEKSNHHLRYPEYKCSPRKSSEIKKRKATSKKTSVALKKASPSVKLSSLMEQTAQETQERSLRNSSRQEVQGFTFDIATGTNTAFAPSLNDQSSVPCPSSTFEPPIGWDDEFAEFMSHGHYEHEPEDIFFETENWGAVDWESRAAALKWFS
jgi:hypothetical protein